MKIVSLKKLLKIRKQNFCQKKIVLVTGCFDILHQGHRCFLNAAKKEGEVLIIGLESDKRIKKLKGPLRPVNCWQKRAENLALLKAVDFIFPLPESFKTAREHFELLKKIKPDVLALSENTPYLEKKKKMIKKIKGRLFVFPFKAPFSTTRLLTKQK